MALSAAHEHNRRAWDQRVQRGQRFTQPAGDADLAGSPDDFDTTGWLEGGLRGKQVLCLAAGGGRQGPRYALAGARVTVVDLSPAMLQLDRAVAAERGLDIRTVEASMDDLSMFQVGQFDLVVQPVSTCYVPDLQPVYRHVARVLRPGGLYISQHKQPASLQAGIQPAHQGYELIVPYYRSGPLPATDECRVREAGTLEFLHRWEELIGGLCRAGFVIEDLSEPPHADDLAAPGSFGHRSRYLAPYVRLKARRLGKATVANTLWTP